MRYFFYFRALNFAFLYALSFTWYNIILFAMILIFTLYPSLFSRCSLPLVRCPLFLRFAPYILLSVLCSLHFALSALLLTFCSFRFAPYILLFVLCSLHFALRALLLTFCSFRFAPFLPGLIAKGNLSLWCNGQRRSRVFYGIPRFQREGALRHYSIHPLLWAMGYLQWH